MQKEGDRLDAMMQRLSLSDHDAYREIFAFMHEPLLKYVHGITKENGLALDVLQDVFMKLWEKREQIEIQVSLKAMLYTMARNRALNVVRNRSRLTYDTEAVEGTELPGSDAPADKYVEAGQLDCYFNAWIAELPPRRAEAFILSRFHALSHREIGEIMGLAKRTVDTHIVHALRFLRERYEKLQQYGTIT